MPERRKEPRPESPDRRTFSRPPLWLNLTLLLLALALFAFGKHQREVIREKTARLFEPAPNSPAELNRIRDELSRIDMTREQLARELDGRMQFLRSLEAEDFYIAVDTSKRKLYFRYGSEVAREADVQIGAAATVHSPDGRTWTFLPLKGAFMVRAKQEGYPWRVPEWVYAMRQEPLPERRPVIENGLGRYVVVLQDNYILHSPPPAGSPLHGQPKPGSILVPEDDLAAIWPRITTRTRVYIF
ncbi:MAG TPA: L,D-transpeptidase [Thermoanaerobaculia bacterium]|nr:L,D-transpeptidase [Thermoanaerobaculia bacterium]